MERDTRSQSSCGTDKSSSVCHKRQRSSNSIISNNSNSSEKLQNHSQKRRRVSCISQNDNDDDILKLDPIENCLSPFSNGDINGHYNGQNQNSYNHNNFSNNYKNNNLNKNSNFNKKNHFNKNNHHFNNNSNYNNNNTNNNNYNNNKTRNNNYNSNSNNKNQNKNNNNWFQKNQRLNHGNNKNINNRPFIPFQQRINDLQERLDEKELQLKETKIDVMNRESDITEQKIKHDRELLEIEIAHSRKIKEMQFKEEDLIQTHKDEVTKLKLALENKKDIILKLRKEVEDAKNEIIVTRAILETTNNRNVELARKNAELLDTKKRNTSNKKIQTEGIISEIPADNDSETKKIHMSPPQSTVVHSTTKSDHQSDVCNFYPRSFDKNNDRFIRNDSSDSGVSIGKTESINSQTSIENEQRYENDLLDATKSNFLSVAHKDKSNELLKLIYKKSAKNPIRQNLTINIDGTKSEDYVMVDYIESPDEMPGKNLMDIRSDLNGPKECSEIFYKKFYTNSRKIEEESTEPSDRKIYNENLKESKNLDISKNGYENSIEHSKPTLNHSKSNYNSSSENSLDSKVNATGITTRKEVIKSTELLNDFNGILDKSDECCDKSQENLKFLITSTELFKQDASNLDENIKFCHEISSENSESSIGFTSLSKSLQEKSKKLLESFILMADESIDSGSIKDKNSSISKEVFKSPLRTFEMSPKIYNIPPSSRDSRRSSSDLSKDLSGSSDNLSITSELQDFLNLSESEPTDEPLISVPISEADFQEFALKFKEKFTQNKIQKAARDLLHIPIVPCYINHIEKTRESDTDRSKSVNNFSNEKKHQNEQYSDHKTTIETDTKIDNNKNCDNDEANSALLLNNSIKLEKDANVSENETDIDEYHNAVVRSIIKHESGNVSSDETSSISSHCITSADDNILKYENNLTDKILADKNVTDKDLRVETEKGTFVCADDKNNQLQEQNENEGRRVDDFRSADLNLNARKSTESDANSKSDNLSDSHEKIESELSKVSSEVALNLNSEKTSRKIENSVPNEKNLNNFAQTSPLSHQISNNEVKNATKFSQNIENPLMIYQNLISDQPNSALLVQNPSESIQSPNTLQNSSILEQILSSNNKNPPNTPKMMQKIDDNCPSYLHSFQDFLTDRCIPVNPTLKNIDNANSSENPNPSPIEISIQDFLKQQMEKNKREQHQKDFQQKQQSLPIKKRRESILVDSHRVKRQKMESRSKKVLKVVEKLQNIVERKLIGLKVPELENEKDNSTKSTQNSSHIISNNILLKNDHLSSETIQHVQPKNVQIELNSVSNNSVASHESNCQVNDSQKSSSKLISELKEINIFKNQDTAHNIRSSTDTEQINQHKPSNETTSTSENNKQNVSQADCISIERSSSTEIPSNNDDLKINHNDSTQILKGPYASADLSKNVEDLMTNLHSDSVTDSVTNKTSNETDSKRLNELKHNSNESVSNSPVSSIKSRENYRSVTPEYKGSPCSSGNDFGMSPVESYERRRTNPTKKSSPPKTNRSPFKVDIKKPQNLPSEDEMGVCSQIVATTLKKSQQQREMSRSSEERMMQNGSFQGYSRNEQFYGYRNERVDSGFNTNERSNFHGNKFSHQNDKNQRNNNQSNISPIDKKPFERSISHAPQDYQPKSPKFLRSNSYQETQFKHNQRTPLTVPFRLIKKPSFINVNPNIQHVKNRIPSPSPSPPSLVIDEQNFKRVQNKNEISQLVITELTVFYDLRKFESDNPKELFKSMARAITYHFYDKNPDIVPNKNVIKNYVMEVFYNYGTIRSEKDFLLADEYDDD